MGPGVGFFGSVRSGDRIRAITPPGCWGPMITPEFHGGHEVTQPVFVEDAQIGDAIAIFIEDVSVLSLAASSGVMRLNKLAYGDDPFVDKKCPKCGIAWPASLVRGTGENAIHCAKCGAEASPFHFEEGYTVAFDTAVSLSVAVDARLAHSYALQAKKYAALPTTSEQHPIILFEPHTLTGLPVRVRPSIGNIGTTPSVTIPDSHNAGDFGQFLLGASHQYAITKEKLDRCITDAHLDCKDVRAGAVLLCPVKVEGGGVYMGDAHSIIGSGEIALHAVDVTADITVKVKLIKDLELEGPLLFPNPEDLPEIAKPLTEQEIKSFKSFGKRLGVRPSLDLRPVQFIGTGKDINSATDNAVSRAAKFLERTEAEIRNRAVITGCVQISRLPGVVQLSLLLPCDLLEEKGIAELVRN